MPRQARGEVIDPSEVQVVHVFSVVFAGRTCATMILLAGNRSSIEGAGFVIDWSFLLPSLGLIAEPSIDVSKV